MQEIARARAQVEARDAAAATGAGRVRAAAAARAEEESEIDISDFMASLLSNTPLPDRASAAVERRKSSIGSAMLSRS